MRTLRRFWNWVTRYCCETCQRCERRVGLVWFANNDLYVRLTGITRGSPGRDGMNYGGIFCIQCFDDLARPAGVLLRWVPFVVDELVEGAWVRREGDRFPGTLYPAVFRG